MNVFRIRPSNGNSAIRLSAESQTLYDQLRCAWCGDPKRAPNATLQLTNLEYVDTVDPIILVSKSQFHLVHNDLFSRWASLFADVLIVHRVVDNKMLEEYTLMMLGRKCIIPTMPTQYRQMGRCPKCERIYAVAPFDAPWWISRRSEFPGHLATGYARSEIYADDVGLAAVPEHMRGRIEVVAVEVRDDPIPYGSVFARDDTFEYAERRQVLE